MHSPFNSEANTSHNRLSHQSDTIVDRIHREILDLKNEGRKLGLTLRLIIPAAIVFVGSAGPALFFSLWITSHITKDCDCDPWSKHAFYLNEGVKQIGDQEVPRLFGLTISSAASKAASVTSSAFAALCSFHAARTWLSLSAVSPEEYGLPTPLQYGLIINLLTDAGLGSLISAARYFIRGPKHRAGITPLLGHSFFAILIMYILTNAISLVDLWLHSGTSAASIPGIFPVTRPFPYSIDQVACSPYPAQWWDADICFMTENGWGDGVSSKVPGMLVRANKSDTLQVITYEQSTAILVTPDLEQDLLFRAKTFGARASCESVNSLCTSPTASNCTGFPADFPPYNGTSNVDVGLRGGDSKLFIQSSNCAWNASDSCPHISSDRFAHLAKLSPEREPVNAYNLWMQFLWKSESGASYGIGAGEESGAVSSFDDFATMLANCTLSFYNVTTEYYNGTWKPLYEELSNTGLSDGLAGPTRLGHFSSHLISNIEGDVFFETEADLLMEKLEIELARLALASAAAITNVTTGTTMQSFVSRGVTGIYPLWPVVIFIALLYIYGAFAFVVFITIVISMQTDYLAFSRHDASTGNVYGKQVTILELTQMRLRGTLPTVATLFPPYRPDVSRAALSVETNELDIFREKFDDARLRAGVHTDEDTGTLSFRIRRKQPSDFQGSVNDADIPTKFE
ncbi:hypothetical protein QCA50_007261 [Cerrena zonata]|uniref:Uncharacterized protein n=1 Tax=Cerrena zonata TaxID=2478898 RepID=A0AAW0GI98_9APHY